jgi:YegS/Rv2252/BmrU family lipid kinase
LTPSRQENRIALLCNPGAGKGRALRVARQMAEKLRLHELECTFFSGQWPSGLDGFSSVWIAGGDGTIHEFVNCYPGLKLPVALFRAGSGNDFAWKLYGDLSTDEFFLRALAGVTKEVDIGLCNGRYFVNGVGIGFDGDVVKKMGNKKLLTAGHLSYLAVVLKNIFLFREKQMDITAGEWRRKGQFFMLAAANGSRYGGGFQVAPRAKLDDGLLDMVLVKPIGLLSRFRYLRVIRHGRHLDLPFIEWIQTGKITIRSSSILSAHLDGELIESDFFEISLSAHRFLFVC